MAGEMQMESAKELQKEEAISQGNELTDYKVGTSAWPPGLREPSYSGDRIRDKQGRKAIWTVTSTHTANRSVPSIYP